ncbi:HEPN domain-containing protein [Streptomyces sp. PR69]|uniref:HEPN domain-containing protein n=1 Tax=Streptomyces sp. PR69 TaxID=2984950 RepID=UPI00226510DC|nr:HEPN domain-containing protein [Streptomyces sp. PR69]
MVDESQVSPKNAQSQGAELDLDLSVLTWMEEVAGTNLLAYLMNSDADSIRRLISGTFALSQPQGQNVREFEGLRNLVSQQFGQHPPESVMGAVLTQVRDDGRSVAHSLHLQAAGSEEIPASEDEIERALVALALDIYPAFLLPPEPDPLPMMPFHTPFVVAGLLHRHPQTKSFLNAALQDSVLKKVFTSENEGTGRVAYVYTNAGRGVTVQLVMLPDMLLNAAWRHVQGAEIDPVSFAKAALEELRLVRAVFAGKTCTITARVAFTGVLLPEGEKFEIDKGVVRAATDLDRQYAPESLRAKLSGTDASGTSTVINYDGDVLLEYKYPYKVKAQALSTEDVDSQWPSEMLPSRDFQTVATRLRFSLMLAVDRDSRAQLVQTWTHFDDPLGYSVSWNDPRQGTAIMPIQLTSEEVASWCDWYGRLNAEPVAKIDLALTRILRAIAERREPSDVLIDSVIAWESLFGTKEGEPTFRVTSCIAKLLADSVEERIALRTRLGKIYALRSKVVHGNSNLKTEDYPLCQEALDFGIRVVKILVADRTDILELPDGAARSARLLLGD